jgi:hypothetical protein
MIMQQTAEQSTSLWMVSSSPKCWPSNALKPTFRYMAEGVSGELIVFFTSRQINQPC